ncbi:hypothetical protein [Vitreoscilla filiformis]|uniref:hypothetical protein n=1 Tax=Vitreoscilla filiformis TaxID=63 RepID=UPI0012FE306B|nr:hypothetical protein [Vitreoscilla filiformis]
MSHISIAKQVFLAITENLHNGYIPVFLRPLSTTGTVQDDPFDQWFGENISQKLPDLEITHSGPLTTPDIIIRDRITREVIGIEVKKVDADENGKDSRGLTLDYNSCIPCGQMLIKIGGRESKIKTYYFFGLLSCDGNNLIASSLIDGDFLNYDYELHLQGKYLNTSQYGHGPYGEGSVRGRAMYNYPNPMNVAIATFSKKHSLVIKQEFSYQLDNSHLNESAIIERKDIKGNVTHYTQYITTNTDKVSHVTDIFASCKQRTPKKRKAYLTEISDVPANYTPNKSTEII